MFALLGATTVGQLVRKGLQCSSSWDEQSFAGLSAVTGDQVVPAHRQW